MLALRQALDDYARYVIDSRENGIKPVRFADYLSFCTTKVTPATHWVPNPFDRNPDGFTTLCGTTTGTYASVHGYEAHVTCEECKTAMHAIPMGADGSLAQSWKCSCGWVNCKLGSCGNTEGCGRSRTVTRDAAPLYGLAGPSPMADVLRLLKEARDLAALGDIDASTETYGWGKWFAETEAALVRHG